jgi:predicted amidohydrolase YtcJ
VLDEAGLIQTLNDTAGSGWLRGVGYHEHVAGDIDRSWLDRHGPPRPVRLQHRSGRLWILNSRALQALGLNSPADGRLFDQDELLRGTALSATEIHDASRALAAFGVTSFTDMTPRNDSDTCAQYLRHRQTGDILQKVTLAGRLADGITLRKFHLHDDHLPAFDALCDDITAAHTSGIPIAVHAVTELSLVYTLSALERVGTHPGDRIEHASVVPPALLPVLAERGVTVVTQPNFVRERGDAYRQDIPVEEHGWLYRGQSFLQHDIPLAAGTDAPFGEADPWAAMQAAMDRRTAAGTALGPDEALTPECAIRLFLGHADAPAQPRRLAAGAPADVCLLSAPWSEVRQALADIRPRSVWIHGEPVGGREQLEATAADRAD